MVDLFLRAQKDATLSAERPDVLAPFLFGEGVNDLQLDSNYDVRLVTGTEKLAQDIVKILLTDRGSNSLFPLYGAGLQGLIGQKMDLEFLRGQIKTEVIDALIVLQAINVDNPNLDEQINVLKSIKIDLSTPAELKLQLVVTTKSQKDVGVIVTIL